MKFSDGKYLLVCGFDLCSREFYGRQNQVYCCSKCKQAFNNRKTSMVNKAANGADLKIRRAVRILLEIFKPDKEGKCVIHEVGLISKAFPFDLPTNPIKDDRYNGTMHGFGSFCFYQQGGNFIFYLI
jgi:hypothetical protein